MLLGLGESYGTGPTGKPLTSARQTRLLQSLNNGDASAVLYCGSIFGQWFDSEVCGIPSQAQIRQQQIDELAGTSMTAAGQAAAVAAGDATIAGDMASHPQDYANQDAAANNPLSSAAFGSSTVAFLSGTPGASLPAWVWVAGIAAVAWWAVKR